MFARRLRPADGVGSTLPRRVPARVDAWASSCLHSRLLTSLPPRNIQTLSRPLHTPASFATQRFWVVAVPYAAFRLDTAVQ